jgi:hypothetical protein
MGDILKASTQYNDIVGSAAFDGHDGPPLFELAKKSTMPEQGYWPVGFELFQLDPDVDGNIPFTLLAVMSEETGEKIEDIIAHARTTEKLTVYRYRGALNPSDFGKLFKRIDIKALRKDLPREKVVLEYPPEE